MQHFKTRYTGIPPLKRFSLKWFPILHTFKEIRRANNNKNKQYNPPRKFKFTFITGRVHTILGMEE